MWTSIVEWLRSPYTLIKLIRLWAILGCVMLVLMLLNRQHLYAVILSTMLLAFFVLSMLIEKVVGEKSENTSDDS